MLSADRPPGGWRAHLCTSGLSINSPCLLSNETFLYKIPTVTLFSARYSGLFLRCIITWELHCESYRAAHRRPSGSSAADGQYFLHDAYSLCILMGIWLWLIIYINWMLATSSGVPSLIIICGVISTLWEAMFTAAMDATSWIHHFVSDWNNSTTVRWIALYFGLDI